jgi:hypothetical protein
MAYNINIKLIGFTYHYLTVGGLAMDFEDDLPFEFSTSSLSLSFASDSNFR